MRTLATLALLALSAALVGAAQAPAPSPTSALGAQTTQLESELVARSGEAQRARAHRGIAQVAAMWRAEDGDANAFAAFVRENFAGDQATLDAMFTRYQHNMEMILGHTHEIHRELLEPSELDVGPIAPYDEVFGGWSPTAHLYDDLFENRLAFVALLNFPLTSLDERTAQGTSWSRRQWAETLLAVYSHMIEEMLYLPDYPIGHMIALQVETQMDKAGNFGSEFERVARIGAVAPDLWMTQATGAPVGPDALLAAAEKALDAL